MTRRALGILFALALALRLAVLFELRGTLLSELLVGDGKAFDAWGRTIASGDWVGKEVFYQAPLYPYFLGLVHALGGDAEWARVVQALLGACGCTLVAGASAALLGKRAGWAAGLLAAVYAPAIWLDVTIQKGSLALFLASLVLFAYAELATHGRARWAASLGAALGLLSLVNENALVLVPVFGLYLVVTRERRLSLVPFLAAFALVLLPVGLRNAALGGTFLPTASNFGVNFYIGNGAGADGMYRPLAAGRGHPEFESADAKALAERELGRALTPAQVSFYWLGRGWRDVREDPARFAGLLARKTRLLLSRAEIMDAEALELHAGHSSVLRVLWSFAHFGLVFPLAALGLLLAWRERGRLGPVALAALALGASFLSFFIVARLRATMLPFLVPFAAFGALEIARRLRSPAGRRTLLLPVAGALFALLAAFAPLELAGDPRATALSNLASELLRRGDFARALEVAQAALGADPDDANALYNLGVAAKELGRTDVAEASLVRAAALEPAYLGEAARLRGQMHALAGDLEGAIALLREAVALDPESAEARHDLGLALRRADRPDEAALEYLEAIRLRPDYVEAHHDLGYLRELQGRLDEARASYRRALELDPDNALSRAALARIAGG